MFGKIEHKRGIHYPFPSFVEQMAQTRTQFILIAWSGLSQRSIRLLLSWIGAVWNEFDIHKGMWNLAITFQRLISACSIFLTISYRAFLKDPNILQRFPGNDKRDSSEPKYILTKYVFLASLLTLAILQSGITRGLFSSDDHLEVEKLQWHLQILLPGVLNWPVV